MKNWKKKACLALAGAMLLLTACGGGASSGENSTAGMETTGQYVEKDITPAGIEDNMLEVFKTPDGNLVSYDQGLKNKYTSADGGENWEHMPGPGASDPRLETATNSTMAEDGTLYVALQEATKADDGKAYMIWKITPDGKVEPFAVQELDEAVAEGDYPSVMLMKALSQNRILLNYVYGMGGMGMGEAPEEGAEEGAGTQSGLEASGASTAGGELPAAEGIAMQPDAEAGAVSDTSGSVEGDGTEDNSDGMMMAPDYTNKTQLMDTETGEIVTEFADWMGLNVVADQEIIYQLDYDGKVVGYSLKDGAVDDSVKGEFAIGDMMFSAEMAIDEEGKLYFVDNKSIQTQKPDGEEKSETLMDGSAYAFGSPTVYLENIMVLADKSIVVTVSDETGSKVYKYTWDANAKVDPAKTLKIWSLDESEAVRAAISAYRKKNPDTTIHYEVAKADSGITTNDAIQNLNTRLLAGDGPDLIVLDGCPIESYVEKGLLADLTKTVNTDEMFSQLTDAFKGDKGTFVLPTRFKLPLLAGSKENLANADTLEKLVEQVNAGNVTPPVTDGEDSFSPIAEDQRPVLAMNSLQELFKILWSSSASEIITKEGVNPESLQRVLEAMKAISDKYGMAEWPEEGFAGGAMAMSSGTNSFSVIEGSPLNYASQRANLGAFTAEELQILMYLQEIPGTEMVNFPGLTDGAWIPTNMIGISADSKVQELAADFLQNTLSKEVQGVRLNGGYPVTQAGLDKQVADLNELIKESKTSFAFDFAPIIENLKTPQFTDEVIMDKCYEAARDYCKGDKDLEGTVSRIEQELRNYLAERK